MRICVAGVGRAFRLRRAVIGMAASLPLLGIAVAVPLAQAQTAPAAGASLGIEEVVVTATRRSELLSDVPISVTSFGDEELQQRGVKQFDDLVRLTPGLNLSRQSFTGASQIATAVTTT